MYGTGNKHILKQNFGELCHFHLTEFHVFPCFPMFSSHVFPVLRVFPEAAALLVQSLDIEEPEIFRKRQGPSCVSLRFAVLRIALGHRMTPLMPGAVEGLGYMGEEALKRLGL